ncbi:hypothetical protein LOK49_LG03G01076 [Camellia lanceoleosa]|uniref:Uncharacterized protein n=1 Tax=Camellia lanceoleosa TaxID=1840588 RepID=A0ACC0IEK2_9ERIC|nr:hypothetical protein LOK49_LG03G01076 [Camellia lanceoleosa]
MGDTAIDSLLENLKWIKANFDLRPTIDLLYKVYNRIKGLELFRKREHEFYLYHGISLCKRFEDVSLRMKVVGSRLSHWCQPMPLVAHTDSCHSNLADFTHAIEEIKQIVVVVTEIYDDLSERNPMWNWEDPTMWRWKEDPTIIDKFHVSSNLHHLIVKCEACLIYGGMNQLGTLCKHLQIMRSLLKGMLMKHYQHDQVQYLVKRVGVVASELESVVSNQAHLENSSYFQMHAFFSKINGVMEDIKAIMEGLIDIYDKMHDIEVLQGGKSSDTSGSSRTITTMVEDEFVVGFDDEAMTIKEQLAGGMKQLEVVSIIGMPGLDGTPLHVDPTFVKPYAPVSKSHVDSTFYSSVSKNRVSSERMRYLSEVFQDRDALKEREKLLFRNNCFDLNPTYESLPQTFILLRVLDLSCRNDLLTGTPNLRKLGFRGHLISMSGDLELPDLSCLIHLETLKLDNRAPVRSSALQLDGVCLSNAQLVLPTNLKSLTLRGTRIKWREMWMIGLLHNLEVLKLEINACQGPRWETTDGGFHQLKFLKFKLLSVERWITSSAHFPSLQHLVIENCVLLEEIPSGVGDILTLQIIEMKQKAQKVGQKKNEDAISSCGVLISWFLASKSGGRICFQNCFRRLHMKLRSWEIDQHTKTTVPPFSISNDDDRISVSPTLSIMAVFGTLNLALASLRIRRSHISPSLTTMIEHPI